MFKRISRRAFLAGTGLGGAAFLGYAGFVEPGWLEVGRHHIITGAATEPIRLLHVADFHASWCVSLACIDRAIDQGLALKPDLICVTGDFITNKFGDMENYSRILSRLPAAAPTFACFGNHDGGRWAVRHRGNPTTQWVGNLLQKGGIELLHNRSTEVRLKNRALRLVGVGDVYAGEINPQRAFAMAGRPGIYTILLSHNPDTKTMLNSYPWDLMLCGHTHGGQFWMPIIGAPFAPVRDKRYIAGLYRWNNRWLHITKGVGNVYGLRFNCRPEVSLLTLA
jgi:predicted MPP superfamily phosphohydrolase